MDDLLGEIRLLIKRQNKRVGNHIINAVGAHCPGIAQIAHLNGHGAMRENAKASGISVTSQVHRNIHLMLIHMLRYIAIAFKTKIVELIEGLDKSRPHVALVVWTNGYAQHFEARPIVQLKQFCRQKSYGVMFKISR